MRALLALLVPVCVAGCFAPTTSTQRLNDAAYDMNLATRFGRMDIAAEHVAAKASAEWQLHHAEWGRRVRIVDVELGGAAITKKDNAEVLINVTWQHVDEANIRQTTLSQTWADDHGSWRMMTETEKAGDTGLLLEPKPAAPAGSGSAVAGAPPAPAGGAPNKVPAFQTRVIYEDANND
jgi:hypothetical protein